MTARRIKAAVVGASISNSPDGRERFALRAHLPALKALSDLYEVVATCTTRMETATAAARHFQFPHAAQDSRHLDPTGIAIGRARVQHAPSAMLGSAESAPNRRHRADVG